MQDGVCCGVGHDPAIGRPIHAEAEKEIGSHLREAPVWPFRQKTPNPSFGGIADRQNAEYAEALKRAVGALGPGRTP